MITCDQCKRDTDSVQLFSPLFTQPAHICETCAHVLTKTEKRNVMRSVGIHSYWCDAMLIPEVYRRKRLQHMTGNGIAEKIQKASQYALAHDGSVLIIGPVGAGKTHLAVGLMYEWVESRIDVYIDSYGEFALKERPELKIAFKSASDLASDIKQARALWMPPESVIGQYIHYPKLVLDDLGAEAATEDTILAFKSLIDRRFRYGHARMIVTSNLSVDDLAITYDDRTISRLLHRGIVIQLDGYDRRIKP